MRLPLMTRSLPSTSTVPENGPWTESRWNSMALALGEARSLIETSSRSWSVRSRMARATFRPIRPKPLIATFVAMSKLLPELVQPPENLREDPFDRETEMFEQHFGRGRCAEAIDADGEAIANVFLPAQRNAGFDGNLENVGGQQ